MKESIESGWLIEYNKNDGNYPKYWSGDHIDHGSKLEWTYDSTIAVRFSRKVDAEMVMVGVLGFRIPCKIFSAQEHEWG